MEEVLIRFGHIGLKIFQQLNNQSLANCNEISQFWQDFIHREKISSFQTFKLYTNLSDASIIKILCKSDADQAAKLANNVTSVYKKTPLNKSTGTTQLHIAAEYGFLEICEIIVENTEEKNSKNNRCVTNNPKNNWGVTPLHRAAENGHLEVCKLIVKNIHCVQKERCKKYECLKNPKNIYKLTPLHMAAINGHVQVCKLIIENVCVNPKPESDMGDPKNPKSLGGTTPLHNAALNGHLQVCQLIAENVQDKNPKDRYRHTPFDYAIRNGHTLVANFFESIGLKSDMKLEPWRQARSQILQQSQKTENLMFKINGIHKVTFCPHGQCGHVE